MKNIMSVDNCRLQYIRLRHKMLILTVSIFTLWACKKESAVSVIPGTLSSTTTSFTKPSDIVTFSWTASAVNNSKTALGLFLELDKKGAGFANATKVYLGRDILSMKYKGNEFNDILKNQMQLPSGITNAIEVRLKSISSDGTVETFYSNVLQMSVKPYDPPPPPPYSKLWIVGDATPAGWNINSPTPMVRDPNDPYVFSYTGALKSGEFKIPTSTGDWGTDFYMPLTPHQDISLTDVQLVKGGNPDNKWYITDAGNYIVTLNLLTKIIVIKKQ